MWQGPGQDPGGGPESGPPPASSQELSDLKDQFEQQQVLIAQLKEMLRRGEQSSVTQEKVDEYMNTLSKRSGRAKKAKSQADGSSRKTLDIPASQKMSLLRQQVEENKLKLAERDKSQKGIEEMVSQIQAQLDDSQQMISHTPHNLSLQDAKIDYSENSSAQELYTVLLSKEKRISDLLAKVQKLESSVLDLQENVKEKDSVIDARTKAISLMTESLSRKNKTSLDALDDTKEQMRKMQENFVLLESEMKARQMKLLEDLKYKNYEIAELQEVNGRLQTQVDEFKQQTDTDELLDTLKAENQRLVESLSEKDLKITELNAKLQEKDENDAQNEEIDKLRKQLDESNKNMIKVKAQHKSKVKELMKKIDAFRKVNDANAELVKLEADNCRLNQKVAELEEEKGSLQLKLVETDSNKGSEATERENDLEAKIQDHVRLLEEKDKIISILEAELSRAKAESDALAEKLNGLSHLENVQVKSEMASIQFEEQMESLEIEKRKLIVENENVAKQMEQLVETVDQMKKEKQELTIKLDHYIQENIELVDKLEKLSAEKVSSAESIEIVEGLTQQEKLELAAYQKNLDLKTSEENLPQVDLNESVNELTEETSELLQRIELFTVERREVMEKMEQLKQENNDLNLKIKEIENNREVLAETYEQLQSEKEALDAKLEAVEAENVDLKEKLAQVNENEQQELNAEAAKKQLELEEEIVLNRTIIEEKQYELDNLKSFVEELEKQLSGVKQENGQLSNTIIDLRRTLSELENENESYRLKITELEDQQNNLSQLVQKNQEEIETISNTDWENRRLLESKDNELTKLMKERDNTESVIQDLQKTMKEKDEKFHKISSEFKDKYLNLQKQLTDNSDNLQNVRGPLEAKIEELLTKNKEQLDKMKKLAANLKKKTQAYQELEDKFKETQTRHDSELKVSLQQLQDLENEVAQLQQRFDDKAEEARVLEEKNVELQTIITDLKIKADKSGEVSLQLQDFENEVARLQQGFDDKADEARVLEEKNVQLQNIITDLKVKADKSGEVSLQQELLLTRENLGSVESSLSAKIQELEMIIETQESELNKSKQRVAKLEEGISFVEERRSSLERKATELGAQLERKEETYEEMSRSEDFLEKRLIALTAHDEAIEKKLQEANLENQDLQQLNELLRQEAEKLRTKLQHLSEKNEAIETQQSVIDELETHNENLRRQMSSLEMEFKAAHNEYDRQLEQHKTDFDKLNSDWQTQFDEVFKERSELLIKCEKFEEELKEIIEKELAFNTELLEHKMKLANSEAEIKNYEEHIRVLSNECAKVKELEQLIRDKDAEIEKKSKQTAPNTLASFFDTVTPVQDVENVTTYKTKIEELERAIRELELQKTAQAAVQSVISQAESSVAPTSNVPTFVWSGQSKDEFDFVGQTKPVENTNQELMDKIKTLEFMVFNAEKEKEEALVQCEQLTDEVTCLVYNQQPRVLEPDWKIEPQLMSRDEANLSSSVQPAMPSLEDARILESQIVSDAAIADTPETHHQLQQIEFEPTQPPQSSAEGPVNEEPCTSKEAYVCTFGENDDGWGWGPEEAKLEEEHAQSAENVDTLKHKIRVLELERENHVEEIRQLQVKSGKLIKKLKEFKAKNEELSQSRKKSDSDLFSLDDTIQEELKLQIQQVEKRLKETAAELEKEKSEKASVLKRVEVLTAANERMVEMKEKQDVELLGWQHNNRELSAKLERFEWGNDGFASTESVEQKPSESKENIDVLNKKIQELNDTVKDLTLDNDELQALLEEQRKLRVDAEKTTVAVDNSQFIEENLSLSKQLQLSGEEKKLLQDQVNELIRNNTELTEKLEHIERQYNELSALLAEKEKAIAHLHEQLGHSETEKQDLCTELQEKYDQIDAFKIGLENEKEKLIKEVEEKNALITTLKHSLEVDEAAVRVEKENLIKEIQDKNAFIDSLQARIENVIALEHKQDSLIRELEEKNIVIESLKVSASAEQELEAKTSQIESLKQSLNAEIASLRAELDQQIQTAQTLLAEKTATSELMAEKDGEIAKLSVAMDQMTQEWQMRIDQRGSDVAESWKLHLESRETEFAQLEQVLRKEIGELEEKTNALVNENNELRKNVDAEIRNEVDRVAALQQQINDRQQYINELTRTLQEKQTEVDSAQEELQAVKKSLEDEKQIVDVVLGEVHDRFDQTVARTGESLARVFVEKEEAVVALHKEVEDLKTKLGSLQEEHANSLEEVRRLNVALQERNQAVAALNIQIQEIQNLKDYENENIHNLQQNLIEYQQFNSNISAQLQAKSAEVEEKNSDIESLRQKVEDKQREHEYALEQLSQEYRATISEQRQEIETLKRRLIDNDNRYEELLQNKDIDLENLHLQLLTQSEAVANKTNELEELTTQHNIKLEEFSVLEAKLDEQTVLLDEENKQLNELRAIIEDQVLKIEQLKKDLFEKSNDYDSLIAEMDISRTASVKEREEQHKTQELKDEDLTEPVSRAELDLALYMLHQRDVRCEELTVELTQLLEERDTLQLRLSNAIREKEDLSRQQASSSGGEASREIKTELAAEALDPLTTKLSELRNVGYKRDKTLLDEQDVRRLQQLSIMQHHRDATARLPPEAAARLVDASYTLSRDVQSPSKVLLNWLWGKSTPKVNNI